MVKRLLKMNETIGKKTQRDLDNEKRLAIKITRL